MSHIYILFPDQLGKEEITLKLGQSSRPVQRIQELQVGNGEFLNAMVWKINNAPVVEESLHILLSEYNTRGEWFKIPITTLHALYGILGSANLTCSCSACEPDYNKKRRDRLAL